MNKVTGISISLIKHILFTSCLIVKLVDVFCDIHELDPLTKLNGKNTTSCCFCNTKFKDSKLEAFVFYFLSLIS